MKDRILDRKTFQEGDKIFAEGEVGNLAFVLQSGEVEIVKNAGEDNELVLGTIGAGGIFGEMALIDDSPRMATARGLVGGVYIVVNRQMFEAKLSKADPFIRGLMHVLSDTLRSMSAAKAESVGRKEPEISKE